MPAPRKPYDVAALLDTTDFVESDPIEKFDALNRRAHTLLERLEKVAAAVARLRDREW